MADFAREVRAHLTDPLRLVTALGLSENAQRQGGGVLIRCPVHAEKTPSCSVTRGPDGTIRVRCFGCDFTGDALSLVAVARGLELRGDQFREVLVEACRVWGLHTLGEALRSGRECPERAPVPPPPPPSPPRSYAPGVVELWGSAVDVDRDVVAAAYLSGRNMEPARVVEQRLLRALPEQASLPRWARYRGQSWLETGHRIIARLWDPSGKLVSLRAWRCIDGDSPKRLPPSGHRCSEHVLANRAGVELLRRSSRPVGVVVTEGEPDHVIASLAWPAHAVLGVGSGWWSKRFAERIPRDVPVVIYTDRDPAGERYADGVASTLPGHNVYRRTWR